MPNNATNAGPAKPELAENITLSPDDQAVLIREVTELRSGFALLHEYAVRGELPRELTRNVLYVAESRLGDLCRLTGIELDTAAERDARFTQIRALNVLNRDLERQLGLAGTPAHTQAHLKVLGENFRTWWRADGFGHVSSLSFTQYGQLESEVSCNLFGNTPLLNSPTPISDKERRVLWFQSLSKRGFVLTEVPHEREPAALDCDQNRKALGDLFARCLPSAQITQTTNQSCNGKLILRGVKVFVRELADLQNLVPTGPFSGIEEQY